MPQLLFIHAHSPLHPGTGRSLGAVDLAIARDKATGYPYLPGSSLKGALRAKAAAAPEMKASVVTVFGPNTDVDDGSSGSGCAVFGDANLLFLPIASEKGLFAQVTTEYILERFLRDAGSAGPDGANLKDIGTAVLDGAKVHFEDLGARDVRQAGPGGLLRRALARIPAPLQKEILPRAVCVTDDDFRVLLDQGLDLVTRVRIDHDTNTAQSGGLWLEENMPAETMLWSVVGAFREGPAVERLINDLAPGETYLGGHVTVGRGRTKLYVGAAT